LFDEPIGQSPQLLFKKIRDLHQGLPSRLLELIDSARTGKPENLMKKNPTQDEIYGVDEEKNPGLLEWSFKHKQQKILDFLYGLLRNPWDNQVLMDLAWPKGVPGSQWDSLLAVGCRQKLPTNFPLEKVLGLSARSGKVILVRACEELGINLNTPLNISGENPQSTALHIAAKYGHKQLVKFLIQRNVDKDKGDGKGRTALFLAQLFKHSEIFDYLQNPQTTYINSPSGR
jgi:hypothetical protein